ncbi:MAG: hypothetical protein K2W85_02435, partial [Phycisphaerales bacterium]|nr:hypothetical protein [Phycisphaerales bacterium]
PTVQGVIENVFGRAIRVDPLGNARLGTRVRVPLDLPPESGNRLGEAHQHTALLRSDDLTAVTWARGADGNVYCTLRTFPTPCRADFNRDGTLDFQDIFDFLNAWFASDALADFNTDGSLDFQDMFDFLNAWFNGC